MHHETLHEITQVIAFLAGVIGVGGLVAGSGLLVAETRLTLRLLHNEMEFVQSSEKSQPSV